MIHIVDVAQIDHREALFPAPHVLVLLCRVAVAAAAAIGAGVFLVQRSHYFSFSEAERLARAPGREITPERKGNRISEHNKVGTPKGERPGRRKPATWSASQRVRGIYIYIYIYICIYIYIY